MYYVRLCALNIGRHTTTTHIYSLDMIRRTSGFVFANIKVYSSSFHHKHPPKYGYRIDLRCVVRRALQL